MTEKPLPQPLPIKVFLKRLTYNIVIGVIIIIISLGMGMVGYHHFGMMSWIEAYENAAMILSGMGPLKDIESNEGKIFAGSYALFSGIIFLVVIAIIFGPVIHRFIHRIHLQDRQ